MYNIYKGVQRPLMFKGLKGRFIYIGGSVVIGGLILMVILNNVLGFVIGVLIGGGVIGGGLYLVFKKQSLGLYSKDKTQGVFLIKNRIKIKNGTKK